MTMTEATITMTEIADTMIATTEITDAMTETTVATTETMAATTETMAAEITIETETATEMIVTIFPVNLFVDGKQKTFTVPELYALQPQQHTQKLERL
jgi:hypothetical protein